MGNWIIRLKPSYCEAVLPYWIKKNWTFNLLLTLRKKSENRNLVQISTFNLTKYSCNVPPMLCIYTVVLGQFFLLILGSVGTPHNRATENYGWLNTLSERYMLILWSNMALGQLEGHIAIRILSSSSPKYIYRIHSVTTVLIVIVQDSPRGLEF